MVLSENCLRCGCGYPCAQISELRSGSQHGEPTPGGWKTDEGQSEWDRRPAGVLFLPSQGCSRFASIQPTFINKYLKFQKASIALLALIVEPYLPRKWFHLSQEDHCKFFDVDTPLTLLVTAALTASSLMLDLAAQDASSFSPHFSLTGAVLKCPGQWLLSCDLL